MVSKHVARSSLRLPGPSLARSRSVPAPSLITGLGEKMLTVPPSVNIPVAMTLNRPDFVDVPANTRRSAPCRDECDGAPAAAATLALPAVSAAARAVRTAAAVRNIMVIPPAWRPAGQAAGIPVRSNVSSVSAAPPGTDISSLSPSGAPHPGQNSQMKREIGDDENHGKHPRHHRRSG